MAEMFKEEYLGKDLNGDDVFYYQSSEDEDNYKIKTTDKELIINKNILIALVDYSLEDDHYEKFSVDLSNLEEGFTSLDTLNDYNENLVILKYQTDINCSVGLLQKFNNEDRVDFCIWNSTDLTLSKLSLMLSELQEIEYEDTEDEEEEE